MDREPRWFALLNSVFTAASDIPSEIFHPVSFVYRNEKSEYHHHAPGREDSGREYVQKEFVTKDDCDDPQRKDLYEEKYEPIILTDDYQPLKVEENCNEEVNPDDQYRGESGIDRGESGLNRGESGGVPGEESRAVHIIENDILSPSIIYKQVSTSKVYSPKGLSPKGFSPKEHSPKGHSPKEHSPKGHSPKEHSSGSDSASPEVSTKRYRKDKHRPKPYSRTQTSCHRQRKQPRRELSSLARSVREFANSIYELRKLTNENERKRDEMLLKFFAEESERNRSHEIKMSEMYRACAVSPPHHIRPPLPTPIPGPRVNCYPGPRCCTMLYPGPHHRHHTDSPFVTPTDSGKSPTSSSSGRMESFYGISKDDGL